MIASMSTAVELLTSVFSIDARIIHDPELPHPVVVPLASVRSDAN